jgi:regulator of protease activity HflC (stomatin/prohibitin superfamily)
MNPISIASAIILAILGVTTISALHQPWGATFFLLAVLVLASLKMAQQWEKAVVLRAGKFTAVQGPGLFFIIPVIDAIAGWIDTRIRTTQFTADQTLTRDTVPVDVDAVIFWIVTDVRRAALEVMNYEHAIAWASQTSLREIIGASELATLLSDRKTIDEKLRSIIDGKSAGWGVQVRSVEVRDVRIPEALQDAMSRQAQAERERQARVILGSAEHEIAQKFMDAAKIYADNPVALHLRGMNMLYESVKEKGSTIIVPSSAVESMNLGGLAGLTSLAKK